MCRSPQGRARGTACRRCLPATGMAAPRRYRRCTSGGCDDVVVVLGAAVVDVPAPARAGGRAGLGGGDERVAAGGDLGARIRTRRVCRACITVDTPDVGAAAVRRVLAAARAVGLRPGAGPLRTRPGHPVVIARRHWADWSSARGGRGARPFLQRAPTWSWWTARISPRAPISTSIRTVMPRAPAAKRRTACAATSVARGVSLAERERPPSPSSGHERHRRRPPHPVSRLAAPPSA